MIVSASCRVWHRGLSRDVSGLDNTVVLSLAKSVDAVSWVRGQGC